MPNLPEHSEATSPHAASANPPLLLPLVAHRFYTDFMARLSAQQRSSAPRSTTSAYGDSSSGNGKKTKTHNGTDGSGGAEEEEEEEDAALRRLSRAQCDAVGPLLWQWLLLLHATAQESRANDNEQHHLSEVDVEEHRADPSHTQALLPPRSRLHTPGQVEQLFQTGLSSLVPAAVGRGAAAAVRTPTADLPAPWHATKDEPYASPSSPYADAHRSLVRALVRLSTNGPLFSSWCALCYECMFALPSVEVAAEAEQRGGGGVEACHPTAPVAVARVQDAWDTACAPYSRGKKTQTVGEGQKTHGNAHPAHQASISGQSNTDDAGASLDAATVAQLWQEVYKHTATNHTGRAGSPGESSAASHAHPLFPLWVSQWYVECCRIASHGRDDGFQVKSVPFTVLRRVMHYLCRRLIEEEEEVVVVGEGSPRLLREMPVSASTTTASTSSVIGESTTKGHRAASSTRQSAPLTVATLTGLALKAPAVDGAGKQRRATREGKRRRGWHDSDDDNDEDGDSSQEEGEIDVGNLVYRGPGGGGRSAFQRFLSRSEQPYAVSIAAAVLCSYSLSPSLRTSLVTPEQQQEQERKNEGGKAKQEDSKVYGENTPRSCFPGADEEMEKGDDTRYDAVRILREVYLRNGEVRWWTLGDSQRHRQLMADKRV